MLLLLTGIRRIVSIHAPTWGATKSTDSPTLVRVVSIHAPTWGATTYEGMTNDNDTFQSTLPHGERPDECHGADATGSFNPRSHMGSDRIAVRDFSRIVVSIHAPTWGATQEGRGCWIYHRVSIHAPTWGATGGLGLGSGTSGFQSTLPHGERLKIHGINIRQSRFQSTLPHGERRRIPVLN